MRAAVLLIGLVCLCPCDAAAQVAVPPADREARPSPRPAPDAVPGYKKKLIQGFVVFVNNQVLDQDVSVFKRTPLDVLELELKTIRQVIRPTDVQVLQKGLPIWVEWEEPSPGTPNMVALYYGGSQFSLLRKGQNPLKANCVEILNLKRLTQLRQPNVPGQQCIILHEIAHAIHHQVIGYGNPAIRAVYQQAMDRRLYDEVENAFGRRGKAYAATNEFEYFAELSCAYLDRCRIYPFTRDDLKQHDPAGYKLMESIWGKPYQLVLAERNRPTERVPAARSAAPAVAAGPDPEATASRRLRFARELLADGMADQARDRLEGLIHTYPKTQAALSARDMLDALGPRD